MPVSIKKILNLNEPLEAGENDDLSSNGLSVTSAPISKDGTPIWKLLVFDVSNISGLAGALKKKIFGRRQEAGTALT
jgi:hypothetical protein